jgi:hypothetical protein
MHLLTGCFPHGLTSHRQWQKYALYGKICNGDLGYGDSAMEIWTAWMAFSMPPSVANKKNAKPVSCETFKRIDQRYRP